MQRHPYLQLVLLFLLSPLVLGAQTTFTEISGDLGMEYNFDHFNYIGGGVAFFDYDGDGDEDYYFTGGINADQLYRNEGDGTFTNVSEGIGLDATATYFTVGVTTGDIDNDGFREIFVTTFGFSNSFSPFRRDLLFKNNGDGTFTEIGALANISSVARSVSATFVDHDQDGFLDIYIVNYVDRVRFVFGSDGEIDGFDHDCFENFFYHNNGDLTFTPVEAELQVNDDGCGLAVTNLDFDQDGDADIYTINDFGQFVVSNQVYLNEPSTGVYDRLVVDDNDINIGLYGMGVAWGDYDLDEDYDYYISNIADNALLNNDGNLHFTDVANAAGVENDFTENNLRVTSWGNAFADIDNDLYEDLFVANGYIPAAPFIATDSIDPNKLFYNNGDGTFTDISTASGFDSPEWGRGLAYADYDQDGDLDVFVNVLKDENNPSNVKLYRNELDNDNNWVQIKLEGTHSNRDAIGSSLELYVTDGPKLLRHVSGGGSHASQHSSISHFGLADFTAIDSVVVRWPNGQEETFTDLAINQRHTLVEASTPLVRIEFNLDMSFQIASDEGVFVEITDEQGGMTRHLMYSPFQDDQYIVFVNRPPGFSGHYQFRNGNCADDSCAEDLSEEGCGDPAMEYARILAPVANDTIVNACFGICPGLVCQSTVDSFQVHFSVNAVTLDEILGENPIYLVGISPDDVPLEMGAPDGDGRYDLSLTLPEEFSAYYTYSNGICADSTCYEDLSGQGCTDPAFDDFRYLPPLTQDTSLNACFGICNSDSCFAPIDTFTVQINLNMTNEDLNPTGVFIVGDFFGPPGATPMFDGNDDGIFTNFFQIPEDFVSSFAFSNGSNCPDGSCIEDLSGQSCADPDQNNYRTFPMISADTVLTFCFGACDTDACLPTPDSVALTINVNMAAAGGASPDGVYWLNDFSPPGTYPMTDPDGDDIYTITLQQPFGYTDYFSFANGLCPDLSCLEDIDGQGCADPFELNYRLLEPIFSDTTLNLCFGSCDADNCVAPIDSFEIQFNLSMAAVDVAPDGVFLAEGLFGAPGTYELTDPDGDQIYTLTIREAEGFSSFYSFTNGNCPDLSCDEDLSGQDCGPPNAGNNRWLPPLSQDTIINTCFAECVPDLNCTLPPQPVSVSFGLHDPLNEAEAVYLSGDFGLTETEFPMTEMVPGDGEWFVSLDLLPGTYQYRFGLGEPMSGVLEAFAGGQADSCTVDVNGQRFRSITVEDTPLELTPVCFESCVYCEIIDNTIDPTADSWTFELQPNPASAQTLVHWSGKHSIFEEVEVQLMNAVGQQLHTYRLNRGQNQLLLNTADLASGFYLIQVSIGESKAVKKLIIR